jgi:hypothetical protein
MSPCANPNYTSIKRETGGGGGIELIKKLIKSNSRRRLSTDFRSGLNGLGTKWRDVLSFRL